MKLQREKPRHLGVSLGYRLARWLPMSQARKLDLLLDLEWIAWRLAHETSVNLGIDRAPNGFLTNAIDPSETVLALGCGTGDVIGSIVGVARRVGVDYDAEKIQAAKRRFPQVEFVIDDLRTFIQKKFDVLILSHILEHLDAPEAVLRGTRNFRRIYVEVPDYESDRLNRLRSIRKRSLNYSDNDHVSEFTRDEIETLFDASGLKILSRQFKEGVMRYWLGFAESSPNNPKVQPSPGK